ncbi:MAG: SDR family oxidoreductase [Bacteroidota bacterium]
MLLTNKIAVVFAASGAIASHVAQAFAQSGARVYLSSHKLAAVQQLADRIKQAGGQAFAHEVDAMDEQAIEDYLQQIVADEGQLDIVFNGIGLRPLESQYGVPTTLLSFDNFMKPIRVHAGSQFLTSRAAARHMVATQHPGTILTLTASLSRLKAPMMAGLTAACTAIEGLTRVMAAEFGQQGIKVICLNPTAFPQTRTIQETNEGMARSLGLPTEQVAQQMVNSSLLGRTPSLEEVGEIAAFMASAPGASFHSHIVDIDCGMPNVI